MMTTDASGDEAGRVLAAALVLGERRGWDALHLFEVAEYMGITLSAIQRHYRHKDDLAQAWFRRADVALVHCGDTPDWLALSVRERLARAILAWLAALEPHKRLSGEMLRYKLQPDHLHLQVQGLMNISSTVQWIRETARLPATGWRRELEEVVLTGIFVSTVLRWLWDDSPGADRTRAWLDARLALAERAARRFPG